jgi:hypothetical protein
VIVTRLPYLPAEARDVSADLDAVEAISDLLGSGRTAVVVGPADALVGALHDNAAINRRTALLTGGLVEAVVRLPGGVYPSRPGHSAALWVLTRDPVAATRGRLLLADLTSGALDRRTVEAAAEDILLWRAEGHRADGHDPHTGQVVDLQALDPRRGGELRLPGPASVTLRARMAADRPALIGEVERRLADAEREAFWYAETAGPMSSGAIQLDGRRPPELSLGVLLKARRLRALPGHRLAPDHIRSHGHHRVLGSAEVTGQPTARWIDRFTLAAEYPHTALTEPGDLVVTPVPHWAVWLDTDGFSVIEFPARGLRIAAEDDLTPLVLKALLDTARNTTRSPAAVRGPRLRDVTIPNLAPEQTRRLDRVLSLIGGRERLLQRQSGLLAELRELAVTGFADGTLTTLYGTNS